MNRILRHIRQSLSLRLSFSILGCTTAIFLVTMGFLYYRSRTAVQRAAIEEATQALNNTTLRIKGLLHEVEVATNNTDWVVMKNLQPDSLFVYSKRILELNPDLFGCSIALEPFFFPEQGEYFSAYTSNTDGHYETEQEGNDNYRYFEQEWYRKPMMQKKACWVDPFYDYDSGEGAYDTEMIASYGKPLVTADGHFIGVISTDISQKWMSQILAQEKPYPHAFYLLVSKEGRLIASGKEDATEDDLERSDCLVFRQQLPSTDWSVCIVCPKRDIFKGYNHLVLIVFSIVVFGLIMMLAFCYLVVRRAVSPLRLLADQTQNMAQGRFDKQLPQATRVDEIGQLQKTFADMQQSINGYVTELRKMKDETEQRNEELVVAKGKAEEADRKKTAFIQELTHQIRTPLNIIGGFAQVLRHDCESLPDEDIESISAGILQNSQDIQTIITNLLSISALDECTAIECDDMVDCNTLCREVAESIIIRYPKTVSIIIETSVPDGFCIRTNKAYLRRTLRELMENANKFTTVGCITIDCRLKGQWVEFSVSDTGKGFAADDRERIFDLFVKLNAFSEGLGLGLWIGRKAARLMGGDLVVDDAYSGGSCFVLMIPVGQGQQPLD